MPTSPAAPPRWPDPFGSQAGLHLTTQLSLRTSNININININGTGCGMPRARYTCPQPKS